MEEVILNQDQVKEIAQFIYKYLDEYINENYEAFLKFVNSQKKRE